MFHLFVICIQDEVPKELLPEPFNSPKRDSYSGIVSVGLGEPKLEVGRFDVHMEEIEQEEQDANKAMPDSTLSHIESRIVEIPVNDSSTPSKDLSTPIRLMSATPTLQLSKRCIELTPEGGDDNSVRSTNSLARGPSRCLNFDTLEEDAIVKDDIGNESADEGDGLLQSVKGSSRSLNFETLEEDTIVKDDISNESGDEKINYEADNDDSLLQSVSDAFLCNHFAFTLFPGLNCLKGLIHFKLQTMLKQPSVLTREERPKTELEQHKLPQLVDLIHRVFHSTNRTVITKEELLHKIIANQINITDRSRES